MSSEADTKYLHSLLRETLAQRALRIPDLQKRFEFVAEELHHALPPRNIILIPGEKPLEDGRGICIRHDPKTDEEKQLLREKEYRTVAVLREIGITAYHPEEVYKARDAMTQAEIAVDLARQTEELPDSDFRVISYNSARATYTGRRANALWFSSSEELQQANPDALSLDSGELAITAAASLFDAQP